MEDLSFPVGPMSVRLESIHAESSPANYVSFLHQSQKPGRGRSDVESIHSVSSVRSVMSGMSAFWSNLGLGSSNASRTEKAKLAADADLKYLYSAFTKIPCLRLAPDHRARLIKGYEEFPFDTAVPLYAFKNVHGLEIIDVDFRQFYGWDKLSEHLVYLTIKRAKLDDPADLLTGIVLDDADKRRRRATKPHSSSSITWILPSPKKTDGTTSTSDPGTPPSDKYATSVSPKQSTLAKERDDTGNDASFSSAGNVSPSRPSASRPTSSYKNVRTKSAMKRSSSGSSDSSEHSLGPKRSGSTATLPLLTALSPYKWHRLKFLSLADNSLTTLSSESLAPIAGTLRSLDLSSNLFTEIPDSLASMVALQSLDLSNCMIESLHSLIRSPLPAITRLKLRSNRLRSIAGVERLPSLESLALQDNKISDPTEMARLTGIPNLREIWVKHNPLTRSHSNYRVTIFNLFRRAPTGYIDDIMIDNAGPGYSERKQLVERAKEPEYPPGSQTTEHARPSRSQEGQQAVPTEEQSSKQDSSVTSSAQQASDRPKALSTQTEYDITSTRRRKGPRRRIVDISKEESVISVKAGPRSSLEASPLDKKSEPTQSSCNETNVTGGIAQPMAKTSPTARDEEETQLLQPDHEWNLGGQDYRQRIEALKKDVGSNWLSVLGEQSFDGHNDALPGGSGCASPHINPTLHNNNSQAILSGGRALV